MLERGLVLGGIALDVLLTALDKYRAGQLDYATAQAHFTDAGWDAGDVDAVLHNLNYTPPGDKAQQFIDQQARARKRQPNPLSRQ